MFGFEKSIEDTFARQQIPLNDSDDNNLSEVDVTKKVNNINKQ